MSRWALLEKIRRRILLIEHSLHCRRKPQRQFWIVEAEGINCCLSLREFSHLVRATNPLRILIDVRSLHSWP